MLDYEEAQKLIFGLEQTKRTENYYTLYEYASKWGTTTDQARRVIEAGVRKGNVRVLTELVRDAGGNRLRKVYGFIELRKRRSK
jgi:Fic family protein